MSLVQKAYQAYERSKNIDLLSFKVQSIIENAKIGNAAIVNQQYNEILQNGNYDIDLITYLNRFIDLQFIERDIEISVIVPFYNRESKIINCLNTILNQTFKNFEIIAIDDGSSDAGSALVHKLKDNRIKLIRCERASGNSGTPRNIGLGLASGKYIAFVDSDDCIEPNFLNELYGAIIREKSQMVIASNFRRIQYIKGKRKENVIYYKYTSGGKQNEENPFFINSFVIWDKLYERKLIIDNNIRFSESRIGADSLFLAKAYLYATKVTICQNKDKYKYFAFSEGSVTKKYRTIANIQEEDRPYQTIFKWLEESEIESKYKFIQWVRRTLSIAYCLKSGNYQINQEETEYLKKVFFNAPFEEILVFLENANLHDNIDSVKKLYNIVY